MREYRFFIPLVRDSDRKLHDSGVWLWLEQELLARFSGFTRDGECDGFWQSPTGRVIEDRNAVYYVAVSVGKIESLRTLLREAAKRFDQQCVYVARIAEHVEVIERCEDTLCLLDTAASIVAQEVVSG